MIVDIHKNPLTVGDRVCITKLPASSYRPKRQLLGETAVIVRIDEYEPYPCILDFEIEEVKAINKFRWKGEEIELLQSDLEVSTENELLDLLS